MINVKHLCGDIHTLAKLKRCDIDIFTHTHLDINGIIGKVDSALEGHTVAYAIANMYTWYTPLVKLHKHGYYMTFKNQTDITIEITWRNGTPYGVPYHNT